MIEMMSIIAWKNLIILTIFPLFFYRNISVLV
jgi:hypothetical protein